MTENTLKEKKTNKSRSCIVKAERSVTENTLKEKQAKEKIWSLPFSGMKPEIFLNANDTVTHNGSCTHGSKNNFHGLTPFLL